MEPTLSESQETMIQELTEQFDKLPVGHTAVVLVISINDLKFVGMRRYRLVHKNKSGLLTSRFNWTFQDEDYSTRPSCFCEKPMSSHKLAKAMAEYCIGWHSEVVHTFKGEVE